MDSTTQQQTKSEGTKAVSVRIPASLYDELDDVSRSSGRTKTFLVKTALQRLFQAQPSLDTRQ